MESKGKISDKRPAHFSRVNKPTEAKSKEVKGDQVNF